MASIGALLKKGGIAEIVAAWQQTPAVTLLALADQYEQAHPGKPFEGDSDTFRVKARKATVAERGPLLRALVGPKSADTLARLEVIAKWDRDPRTSKAVEQLLRDVPYTSDGTRPVWNAVFALVRQLKDPRFVTLRHELVAGWKFRENHKAWMTSALDRAAEELPDEIPELDDADEAAARALAAKLVVAPRPKGDKNEEGLLADVYANPHDDGPRLVYADWLQERGDPRGEFIALQFSAKPDKKREAALLKAHGQKWLGPLAPVVLKGVEFRRGFPSVVTARFKHQKDAEAHGQSPAWATVDELTWSVGTSANDSERWQQFVPPHLQARTLRVGAEGLRQLFALGRTFDFEDLTVWVTDVDLQRALAASERFPRVKRLTVTQHFPPELVAQSWMGKVPHLTIDRLHGHMRPWVAAVAASQVERLTFTFAFLGELTTARPFSTAEFTPVRGASPNQLQNHLSYVSDSWLEGLDPAQLKAKTISIAAPKGSAPKAAGIDAKIQRPLALGWCNGQVCVAERERLLLFDASGAATVAHPINNSSAAAFSPDGRRVALNPYKKLELRDVATGALEASFANPYGTARALQFDPTGTQLLLVADGAMQVHALPDGRLLRKVGFGTYPKRPIHAALSPDGGTLAAALYTDDVNVYPPGATKVTRKFAHGFYTNQVLFLTNDRLVTSCRDGNVRLFDVGEAEPVVKRHVVESPVLLAHPGGKRILASGGTMTRFLDSGTLEEVARLDEVLGFPAFSPDGKRVAGIV